MVTAFGREEVRAQAEEMGIKGYLLKPVSPSLLYDTLMDVFGMAERESGRLRQVRKDAPSPECERNSYPIGRGQRSKPAGGGRAS